MLKKIKNMEPYDLISNIIVLIAALLFLLPLFWLLTNAFKYSTEIYRVPPTIIPERFTLANMKEYLITSQPLDGYLIVSLCHQEQQHLVYCFLG